MTDSFLEVKNLVTSFHTPRGKIKAVDDVSFSIKPGQTLGLVGESGCGKSVTSLSIMGLIPSPPGEIESGQILFEGRDITKLSPEELRKLRGNRMSMIFQEPMTSLNPVFTVGEQIGEVFRVHQGLSKKEARQKAIEMLRLVKVPSPEHRVDDYPHQLSGGMRQRVMIAMALGCSPQLLIADEPTTALDVTIQAQILDLIADLQKKINMAVLLITHDLGVVAQVCDYVVVMYAGKVAEQGPVAEIFRNPSHPYTIGLMASVPKLGQKTEFLQTIDGVVPSLENLPVGCRFQDRCKFAFDKCRKSEPSLKSLGADHQAACWRLES
jgi:oligopeptide/dipeptide ABC transporter ATP-binding protein